MPKKALPKLPVPNAQRCTMQDGRGKRCERRIEYRVTKIDGTVTTLCRTCAYKLRDQNQQHPEYFFTMRFSAITKFTPS